MFYRSPEILITSASIVLLQPDPFRFHLDAIESPYVVRHGRGAGFRVGHEIRARYDGRDVRIYYTTNASAFGAVRRALIRAMEQRSSPLPI